MSKMISVASGFQYSVNIAYDLNSNDKLINFIPTKSSLSLLDEILLSTLPTSTERARVLIGAYGKGKSHIVLMILSILLKKDLALFEKMMPKIEEIPQLKQSVERFYQSGNKILPVVISGSNTSIPQAFLNSLQRTLAENDLLDIMPETNYQAAIETIRRWKNEFPATYVALEETIQMPADKLVSLLQDYSVEAYEMFEKAYPTLTSGSIFNPFLGFDVVELCERAALGLRTKGYTGIYAIYDEFSKYLEANISNASVSDTKMLQDFAEKCNRSGNVQLHVMLISHKEISNYIDTLPKKKVDGWRGVSERYRHIHLNNNFAQIYEIISTVIQKDKEKWSTFVHSHKEEFANLNFRYEKHPIFEDVFGGVEENVIKACYPLHPVSTYVLPRLSERVAQNERTLFTFLSASGTNTLSSFLNRYYEKEFNVLTPDSIYDYFEPLLQKEVYGSDIYQNYALTASILSKVGNGNLEEKIVKTISLIYMLSQFEKLKPTMDEMVGIYSVSYSVDEIELAISNLIEKEFVVYLKRSNNFLKLKKTSGVDIKQKIKDTIQSQESKLNIKTVLNGMNFDNYMYPSRYNDEYEITRYFAFEFINSSEVSDDVDWKIKSQSIDGDGVVYGVIPTSQDDIDRVCNSIRLTSINQNRVVFVVPKNFKDISGIVREYNAVKLLRDAIVDDPMLFNEYDVIFDDLQEVLLDYVGLFIHPENYSAFYIYRGENKKITRKAALTGLLSCICEYIYSETPVINNEAINRDEITSIANNSRNKIISGLLRNEIELNLGLTGSGQEVSIMRSTLIRTGILVEDNGTARINLCPEDKKICNMLKCIERFIQSARQNGKREFNELFNDLTSPEIHIGLKQGLIPIYLATVLHEYKQEAIVLDRFGQVPINAGTLMQIVADPKAYQLSYLDWNPEKEEYIKKLSDIFRSHVLEAEKGINYYDYVAAAMRRWYMSLPKYSKECRRSISGEKIDKRYLAFIKLLKQSISSKEMLFDSIPKAFGYSDGFNIDVYENVSVAKEYYDELLTNLKRQLVIKTKDAFVLPEYCVRVEHMSLSSVIDDWCTSLNPSVFNQLFKDGTDKCLGLFKTVTNDEDMFIARLAKLVTGLHLEDWDDGTHERFFATLSQYKATAEAFNSEDRLVGEGLENSSSYQVSFVGEGGKTITKRFDSVETSKRGKLLYNQITAALSSMGHSITEQEKRQILIDVLKELC
ncbi:restriction endonuclease subunit S [Oribacterium sinus]